MAAIAQCTSMSAVCGTSLSSEGSPLSTPRRALPVATVLRLMLALSLSFPALALASPEEDRVRFVEFFEKRFPGVPPEDYVYGALIANPGGREQYEQIMEFPPFLGDLEAGKKIWETPFHNGRTFADCFPNRGHNVVGDYPFFDEGLGKVVTFEDAINTCLRTNGEGELAYGGPDGMGIVTAYARTLSDGMRISIRVDSPGALAKYEAGKNLFFRRIGQLNAACAGCHLYNAGKIMRMEVISPVLGQATHWPVFRGGEELMTFQGRFKRCMEQMRAVPYGFDSDEWNNLEYFLTYLSNGLPLKSAVFRK
jgi:L-cysteine S-thiosulfotransferase